MNAIFVPYADAPKMIADQSVPDGIAARLHELEIARAGSFRCAHCYGWFAAPAPVVALFKPHDGGRIPYAVCTHCWQRANRSEQGRKQFAARVENYLAGGAA